MEKRGVKTVEEVSKAATASEASPAPAISVVIPSYRRPSDLRRCLGALTSQTRAADEVVVVLRGDDAETVDAICEFRDALKGLRIARVGEPGLVAAINCGLDCATGEIVVLTDDDAEAFPDWLERMEAVFLRGPAIGAAGGRDWIQNSALSEPPTVERVGVMTWWGMQYGNHHCHLRGHTKKVDFLKGVNLAIRRSALGSYRVDTSLRGTGAQVGTELDLCMHMKHAGYEIVFDDRILVKHYASPRPDSRDQVDANYEARTDLSSRVFPDIRFNNHYLTAKHFPLYLSLVHLGNGLLLGSYFTPGLLAGVKYMLKGETAIWRRFLQQAGCALAGFGAGRRARAAARTLGSGADRERL